MFCSFFASNVCSQDIARVPVPSVSEMEGQLLQTNTFVSLARGKVSQYLCEIVVLHWSRAEYTSEMSGCIAGIPVMPADISPAWLAKCRAHWFSE